MVTPIQRPYDHRPPKRRPRPGSGSATATAQRGAEILEFVVALIFVLPLLYMIIEFGVAMIDQATLTHAARAAAREAAVISYAGEDALGYEERQRKAATAFTDTLIHWSRGTDLCADSSCCEFQPLDSSVSGAANPFAATVTVSCRLGFEFQVIKQVLDNPGLALSSRVVFPVIVD